MNFIGFCPMFSQSLKLGSPLKHLHWRLLVVSSLSSIDAGEPAYLQGKLWQYSASILIYYSFQGENMQWVGPNF